MTFLVSYDLTITNESRKQKIVQTVQKRPNGAERRLQIPYGTVGMPLGILIKTH
jgi:hypothetical protein